jgi:hypothetical protein
MATIDRFSLCTVPLGLVANKTPMGVATGFIWKHPEKHYLVTNWHVITGRNARTGKLELPARPDAFRDCSIRAGAAAQLEDLRVREESTLPPEILLPGARHSQDVKCLAVGHAFRSVPHSPTSFNASDGTQAMDLSQVDANNAV